MADTTRYPGHAFLPGPDGRRAAGTLQGTAGALVFTGEGVERRLPLAGLRCRAGGFDDDTLFFSHPGEPGLELTTADRRIAAEGPLADLPEVQSAALQQRRGRRRFCSCAWAALALLLVIALAAVLLVGSLVRWLAQT